MNRRSAKCILQCFALSVCCIPSLAQDSHVEKPTKAIQLQNDSASDVGLNLVSAERVHLTSATVEAMKNTELAPRGSGRVPPDAAKARARLAEVISEWHRFTIVDTPADADLVLTITETNRVSGWKEGVLLEKLKVTRGGPGFANSQTLWESHTQEGSITNYRPIDKCVKEFRSLVEDYEKKLTPEEIARAKKALQTAAGSGGCGEEGKTDLEDCLSHSVAELFLPDDREENRGPVKLAEAVPNVNPLEMESQISTKDFSDYVVAMQKLLHKQLTPEHPQTGWDLAVSGTLQTQGKADIGLQTRPSADQKQLQTFYDNLQNLSAPSVNGNPLEFRVVFTVWGGSEESKNKH